jgi:Na+-translocating ferredoxin:NAD+ oxidoreductase RnfD subunit
MLSHQCPVVVVVAVTVLPVVVVAVVLFVVVVVALIDVVVVVVLAVEVEVVVELLQDAKTNDVRIRIVRTIHIALLFNFSPFGLFHFLVIDC